MKNFKILFLVIAIPPILSSCATTVNINADNSYAAGNTPQVINVWAYRHNSNILNTITHTPLGQDGHYNKNYVVDFPSKNLDKNYYIMIAITQKAPNSISIPGPNTVYWCSKNQYNFSNKGVSISIPNVKKLYPTWIACW